MKAPREVSNIHEVVVDAPCFDESTLSVGDEGGHMRSKPYGEHFCNDLGDSMNETDGSIIDDALRPILLGKQHNIRRIEPVKICCVEGVKALNHPHEVVLDDAPTLLEEEAGEAIRPRRLVARHAIYRLDDLLRGEGRVKLV